MTITARYRTLGKSGFPPHHTPLCPTTAHIIHQMVGARNSNPNFCMQIHHIAWDTLRYAVDRYEALTTEKYEIRMFGDPLVKDVLCCV